MVQVKMRPSGNASICTSQMQVFLLDRGPYIELVGRDVNFYVPSSCIGMFASNERIYFSLPFDFFSRRLTLIKTQAPGLWNESRLSLASEHRKLTEVRNSLERTFQPGGTEDLVAYRSAFHQPRRSGR